MTVSATVLSVCTLASQPLTFGVYSSATLDSTTTLTVVCTSSTPYSIALDAGTGSGATVTTRKMTSGSSTLSYSLSSDSARTLNIGQTVGTNVLTGVGVGTSQTLTIYGRVAPNQYVPAGTYTDTVTATITY